jgi:diphthamide biosynthesis protein 2
MENLTLEEEEPEDTQFSFITGSVKKNPKKQIQIEMEKDEEKTALVARNNNTDIVQTWSPAAEYLNKRTYRGLEQKIGETEVTKAVQGRSGIPMSYAEEPEQIEHS